jgi:hypothetical protein
MPLGLIASLRTAESATSREPKDLIMKPLATGATAVQSRPSLTRGAPAIPIPRYPTPSVIRHGGPLAKLAWIFGSRLRQKSSAKEI